MYKSPTPPQEGKASVWPPAEAWTGAEGDDTLRMLGAYDFVLEELGDGPVDRAAALRAAMEEAEAAADEAAASVASAAAMAVAARAPVPVSFVLEDDAASSDGSSVVEASTTAPTGLGQDAMDGQDTTRLGQDTMVQPSQEVVQSEALVRVCV